MNIDTAFTIAPPLTDQIPMLRQLWQDSFGDTEEFLNSFFATAFHPERCRCATASGQILGALYWFTCEYKNKPVAYLYAIATDNAYRDQGICHRLMQDTHKHLAKLGYQGVLLVPGSQGLFHFYEKMGYRTCSHVDEFCYGNSMEGIDIHQITKDRYANMRRQYLPENSVIQEQENLDFLQTHASFYQGEHFLLAAHGEGDTLTGIELLGDTAAAPHILYTLGFTKGTFRTPGWEIPFAMYYPLSDSQLSPPAYFGLAFD